MANNKAEFMDDMFFLAVILLFLMINYNMPLSQIYSSMVYLALFMYITPILFNLFSWIPLSDKNNRLNEIIVGIVAAIGFIYFYKRLTTTPMAAIFATTAFGDSVYMHKFIFGTLIPTIETVFFFVILPLWVLWKLGKSLKKDLFSMDNIIIIIAFAFIFTLYHATSKGLTNTTELFATWVFGALSMGLIIFFGTVLPALILHLIVNSYSVDLFDIVTVKLTTASPLFILGGIVVVFYLLSTKRIRLPFAG